MPSPPNILLVVWDSVRARNTSLHNHTNQTTPNLEKLANNATVYTQARAPSIHSIASHTSIFTGYDTFEHNVTEHESKLKRGYTIWEKLAREGYETGLFTPNPILTESSNLASFFEIVEGRCTPDEFFDEALGITDFDEPVNSIEYIQCCLSQDEKLKSILNGAFHKLVSAERKKDILKKDESAPIYISKFTEWMNSVSGPWAACINLNDAHFPYFPKSQYNKWGDEKLVELHEEIGRDFIWSIGKRPWWQWEAIEALYDGAIYQLDTYLDDLVISLRDNNEFDDTLLVVTSDHGEGFGESDRIVPELRIANHNYGIHEVLTHIPLVVKWPGQDTKSKISDIAAVKEFPTAVNKALKGKRDDAAFTPDQPVYSSTYRIKTIDTAPESDSQKKYLGPWRAAYIQKNNQLLKYADRDNESAVIEIVDAQSSYRIRSDDDGRTEDFFEAIEEKDIAMGLDDIDDTVEQQLSDLGYIR